MVWVFSGTEWIDGEGEVAITLVVVVVVVVVVEGVDDIDDIDDAGRGVETSPSEKG